MIEENKSFICFVFVDVDDVESKMLNIGPATWQCTVCSYTSQRGNVKKHIESRHVTPKDDFFCTLCLKLISGYGNFHNHQQYHRRKANKQK